MCGLLYNFSKLFMGAFTNDIRIFFVLLNRTKISTNKSSSKLAARHDRIDKTFRNSIRKIRTLTSSTNTEL